MTGFTEDQLAALQAPLAITHVKNREQAGRSFSYIEAWHAINEANRIFGFDSWDREMLDCRCVTEAPCRIQVGTKWERDGFRVGYVARVRITVRAGDRTIVREGTGYGSGIFDEVGAAHESAIKESESDAMKRGLMTFGYPLGLALYDKTQAHVEAPQKPAGVPNASRSANGTVDPRRAQAVAAKARLMAAISIAALPKTIDAIFTLPENKADIDVIESVSAASYKSLIEAGAAKKAELYGSAP